MDLTYRLYPIYSANYEWVALGRTQQGSLYSLDPIPASKERPAMGDVGIKTEGADMPFLFVEVAWPSERVPGQQAVLVEPTGALTALELLSIAFGGRQDGIRTVMPREAVKRLAASTAPAGEAAPCHR